MKSDINGCSTCLEGQEQYEEYFSTVLNCNVVQYDYRAINGELFSCCAINLRHARDKRDKWLRKNE